jgi:hypothetical protein
VARQPRYRYSLGSTEAVQPDGRLIVDVQQIIPLPEVESTRYRSGEGAERASLGIRSDFTRFDVRIGDELHPAMWKRNAVYLICKASVTGTNPNEIAETSIGGRIAFGTCGWYQNASEFGKLATQASSGGHLILADGFAMRANLSISTARPMRSSQWVERVGTGP